MSEVLVVANRTLGGGALLNAVRARAAAGNVSFRLVVPASTPSAGLVIYDEAVRESAQVRVDLALSVVAGEGITATGEVGDADPFLATMDAIAERRPDEIIVSTHPAVSSGWLRRDLIERIENASGLPVEHVVVDLEQHGLPGMIASGMIGDPDPYTATVNALELFLVDDVVISTLPDERSGWLRANLIERVRGATGVPVEHVVVDLPATTAAATAV